MPSFEDVILDNRLHGVDRGVGGGGGEGGRDEGDVSVVVFEVSVSFLCRFHLKSSIRPQLGTFN